MAFKTFAPGVLTSSDVNTFLMRQAVITCTSSTRPASPSEGMTIYETDTNLYKVYDGSNWIDFASSIGGTYTSFTPTISGADAWSVGNGTWDATYIQLGKLVHARYRFDIGSTTVQPTGANYFFSLPVSRRVGSTANGSGILGDDSLSFFYQGNVRISATVVSFSVFDKVNATNFTLVSKPNSGSPFTWAAGDFFDFDLVYEAA